MGGSKMRLLTVLLAPLLLYEGKLPAQAVTTTVDSARREIVIVAGPFMVPAIDPEMVKEMVKEMETDPGAMHHDEEVRVFRFDWPVDGLGRAFRVEVRDSSGALLPRSLLHHLVAINFDRRQFIYPAAERLFGTGKESPEIGKLPGTLAVPLDKGQRLGFYIAWHNDTGKDLSGVSVRIVINWVSSRYARLYTPVLPIYLDVNNDVGGNNTFDIPPGRSSKAFEFEAPTSGKMIGLTGHMHDYGAALRFEDAETGKVLVRLSAKRDPAGRILGVSRKIFFFRPLKLREGHRYRIVAEYESPLQKTVSDGAMGSIEGVFAPDSPSRWPAIDPDNPTFIKDIESLRVIVPSAGEGGNSTPTTELIRYTRRPAR